MITRILAALMLAALLCGCGDEPEPPATPTPPVTPQPTPTA